VINFQGFSIYDYDFDGEEVGLQSITTPVSLNVQVDKGTVELGKGVGTTGLQYSFVFFLTVSLIISK